MNSLTQLENGILGSKEDCETLAKKATAKILILSDSHGQKRTVSDILTQHGETSDALLFAGDGIGDLVDFFEKAKTKQDFMKCLPPVIAFVQGNNDPHSFPISFNSAPLKIPKYIFVKIAGKKIFLTHGHSYGVYYSLETLETVALQAGCDIAVFGHTHCPVEIWQKIYFVNPGSLCYPRSVSHLSFAIMQIVQNDVYSVFFQKEHQYSGDFVAKKLENFL